MNVCISVCVCGVGVINVSKLAFAGRSHTVTNGFYDDDLL